MKLRDAFSEFRDDGWPLCPACGEDELYSTWAIQCWPKRVEITGYIEHIVGCYHCGWEPSLFFLRRAGDKVGI